jgi:hypothetical protein
MKRKIAILAALVISASIGSQVVNAATSSCTPSFKVGNLSFALSDDYQINVVGNGLQDQHTVTSENGIDLEHCNLSVKYVDQVAKVDTARVIAAIGTAVGHTFTKKAQLALVNYDNELPAPPYPPYLINPASDTYNGPREFNGENGGFGSSTPPAREIIMSMGEWPNDFQIDWVDYDDTQLNTISNDDASGLSANDWPKSHVFVSDPTGSWPCLDVTGFFSIEEAYCYFCWDTVDRVTKGTFSTGTQVTTGDICIGGTTTACQTKGSGTTKFYLTIKFNNIISQNVWIDGNYIDGITEGNGWIPVNYTISAASQKAADWLSFSVGGVVTYPWKIVSVNSHAVAVGTMTMSQANGYGQNPWCGVFTGSVKITETDDCKIPICWTQPINRSTVKRN